MLDFVWMAISALVGLIFTIIMMPFLIEMLKHRNFYSQDMYKHGKVMVPTNGGLIVIFTCFLLLIVFPVFMYVIYLFNAFWFRIPWMMGGPILLSSLIQMGVLVVAIYGLYGLLDDYLKLNHTIKILIPILFAVPLIAPLYYVTFNMPVVGTIDNRVFLVYPFGNIKFINFIRYIIVPIYIMVVANLFNMYSGYNGLQSGLTAIVLAFVILKALTIGKSDEMIGIAAILGTNIGFWLFNKYPSMIFGGNVGSYVMGAAVGVAIVTSGILFAGFVMLIPHTFNFLLYVYSKLRKIKIKKFGTLRKDGTIEAPSNLTLKYIIPYYFHVTEREAVIVCYGITMVFCVIGLLIPF